MVYRDSDTGASVMFLRGSFFVISWNTSGTEEEVENAISLALRSTKVTKLCVAWTRVTRAPLHGMRCQAGMWS